MMSLRQMPAADPDPERLADDTPVRAIQTKVNNKLDPAVPVRTHIRRRVQSLAALASSTNLADSPTTTSPIA